MAFSFGVACFSIGYVREVPYSFSAADYREAVEALLSSVPSVTEISVEVEDSQEVAVVTEAPALMQDGGGLPYLYGTNVSFSVYIPHRVQRELREQINRYGEMVSETFRVKMRGEYHGPVAFVECVGAGGEQDPSMSVFLVREYLKKQLAGNSGPARFDYLGPSPFHGDFYLSHGRGSLDSEFLLTVKARKGYDMYLFEVDKPAVDAEDLDRLFSEISGELALYYSLVRQRRDLLMSASRYERTWASVRESVDSARMSSLWSAARRHRDVRSMISRGYALQAELSVGLSDMKHSVAEEYDAGLPSYFEKRLRREVDRFPQVSVDPILRWAEHVEGTSYKKLEIVAVLAASVIGGLVGAAITAAAS